MPRFPLSHTRARTDHASGCVGFHDRVKSGLVSRRHEATRLDEYGTKQKKVGFGAALAARHQRSQTP